jgi:hypothetical protein
MLRQPLAVQHHPLLPTRELRTVSLREAAQAVESTKPGPKCGVHILKLELEKDDRATLVEWLDPDSGRKSSWIADVLKSEDHDISEITIARHRRGKCSCGTL